MGSLSRGLTSDRQGIRGFDSHRLHPLTLTVESSPGTGQAGPLSVAEQSTSHRLVGAVPACDLCLVMTQQSERLMYP